MNDLTAAVFAISIVGGLYYFWFKCQIFAVSKLTLLIGILMWPVGALVGIYWAIKDYFLFRNAHRSEEEKDVSETEEKENKNFSSVSDNLYLEALEEYESDKKDKALYARLYAENDGKEEVVKAKYIKQRVEKIIELK